MNRLLRTIKNNIPNLFTLLNLLSGCLAILLSFHDIALSGIMVFISGLLDFTDGFAARALNAYSRFGKELDSLADIVSFGVAPSFILYQLILLNLFGGGEVSLLNYLAANDLLLLSTAFLPALFSAIRLARFNLSNPENDSFKGLPTPASGLFIAALGYTIITEASGWVVACMYHIPFLVAVSVFLSFLMVSHLPMFSLKFHGLSHRYNMMRYILVLPSIILLLVWGLKAVLAIIPLYILLSLIQALTGHRTSAA
jgi:CDP-diacylglycerol---serine O-phosphatidyltransferase